MANPPGEDSSAFPILDEEPTTPPPPSPVWPPAGQKVEGVNLDDRTAARLAFFGLGARGRDGCAGVDGLLQAEGGQCNVVFSQVWGSHFFIGSSFFCPESKGHADRPSDYSCLVLCTSPIPSLAL